MTQQWFSAPKRLLTNNLFRAVSYGLLGALVLIFVLALFSTPQATGQSDESIPLLTVDDSQWPNLQIQYTTTNLLIDQAYQVELLENGVPVQRDRFQSKPNFLHNITLVFDVNREYTNPDPQKPKRYLNAVVDALDAIHSEPLHANDDQFTRFSLVIPDINKPNRVTTPPLLPFDTFKGLINQLLNPSGPSDEPFINTYLTTASDEPILLKNTVITLETLSQVQNTILFIADGKGLDENGNTLQTNPSLALQGTPNNIRIFTIPINETLTAPESIDRNFLAQIAQAGHGESFELSQLAGKWANIQTGLSAPWTISYTTQQTQSFTLAVKIAGVEKSVSIAAPVVTSAPTETPTVRPTETPTAPPPEGGETWPSLQIIGGTLFLAILTLIIFSFFRKRKSGTRIDREDQNGQMSPSINNHLSNVVLRKIDGSSDSQSLIEINYADGNEVILGRSQLPPFRIDGTKKTEVSEEHCMVRLLPGGIVELELLAIHKWVAIYRTEQERKTEIVLSQRKGRFKENLQSSDELHLSKTAIYQIFIVRPTGYMADDMEPDGSIISNEPGSIISEEPDDNPANPPSNDSSSENEWSLRRPLEVAEPAKPEPPSPLPLELKESDTNANDSVE